MSPTAPTLAIALLLLGGLVAAQDVHADAFDRLEWWMAENGMGSHSLEVASFPTDVAGVNRRGLRTKVDVLRGDELLRVPAHLFVSKAAVAETEEAAALVEVRDKLPPKVYLALFIMLERSRGDSSFWKPYLDVMPAPSSHLIFFSDQELAQLQCGADESLCPLLPRMRRMKKELRLVFERLAPFMTELLPAGQFTMPAFLRAYTTVISRCFSVNVTSTYGFGLVRNDSSLFGETPFMVPFADLFNHHVSRPALQFSFRFDDAAKSLVLTADANYKAGEEVFIQYGIMTNSDLLINYGFALEDNSFESVGFSLGISEDDPLHDSKQQLLSDYGLGNYTHAHISLDGEANGRFIQAMRVRSLMRQELNETEDGQLFLDREDVMQPISAFNELRVFETLAENAEALLSQFETTLWEDVQLLRNADRPAHYTFNALHAVIYRTEVKRILHAILLEAFWGMRSAYRLLHETYAGQQDDAVVAFWSARSEEWDAKWKAWRTRVDSVWRRRHAPVHVELGDEAREEDEALTVSQFLQFNEMLTQMEGILKRQAAALSKEGVQRDY